LKRKATIKEFICFFIFFLLIFFLLSPFSGKKSWFSLAPIVFTSIGLRIKADSIKKQSLFRLLIMFCTGILSYLAFCIVITQQEPLRSTGFFLLPITGGSLAALSGALIEKLAKFSSLKSVLLISEMFSQNYIKTFLIGALLTFYVAFIRQYLLESIPPIAIGEWVCIVFIISIIYIEIKRKIENFYIEPEISLWQRHVQKVDRHTSKDFEFLKHIQDLFVNSNKKELLLVYYALKLKAKGEDERDILQKVQQLSEHKDIKIPFLAFPWTKKKIQKMNRKAREELLKKIVEEIIEEGPMNGKRKKKV